MASKEMNRDMPEIKMETPFVFTTWISEEFWRELREMSQATYVFHGV